MVLKARNVLADCARRFGRRWTPDVHFGWIALHADSRTPRRVLARGVPWTSLPFRHPARRNPGVAVTIQRNGLRGSMVDGPRGHSLSSPGSQESYP